MPRFSESTLVQYVHRLQRPRLGRCQVAATKSVVLTPLLYFISFEIYSIINILINMDGAFFLWHRHQQNLMRFSLPKAFWQHVLSMISPTKVHQPFFQLLLPGTTCPALGMLETVSFSNHRISSQEVCWIFVRWPKSWGLHQLI